MAAAKFIGVYACNTWPSNVAGSGHKHNWFVWEDGWGRYRAQLLDGAFQPLDNPRVVAEAEFIKHFRYQAQILITPVSQLLLPSVEEEDRLHNLEHEEALKVKRDIAELTAQMNAGSGPQGIPYLHTPGTPETPSPGYNIHTYDSVEAADRAQRDQPAEGVQPTRPTPVSGQGLVDKDSDVVAPEVTAALVEDEHAAKLDDETRASFVVAITRWRRGDKRTSMEAFQRILKLEDGIVPAHKHMYTDFAIDLRKCSLTTLAKEFYRRAVDMAPEDCYARFNLARICFETGEIQSALVELNEALRLEPGFNHAERFRRFLEDHYPKQAKMVARYTGGSDGTGSAGSGDAGSGKAGSGNAGSGNAGSGKAGSGKAGSRRAGAGKSKSNTSSFRIEF